jgi:hypothetical protein
MRAKSVKGNKQLQIHLNEINSRINKFDSEIGRLEAYFNHLGISPTPDMVKRALNNAFNPGKGTVDPSETLNSYIERFIKEMETGMLLTDKGQKYQLGTIKNYKGFQTQFNAYQDSRRKKLDFDDINIDFYDDFHQFFNDKSYKPNTIGRHVKNLKTIIRASREEGLHNNNETERKKFKVLRVDTDQIYLNEEELTKLYELNLTDNPQLELARDVFLIGCFTALRFSDYSRIRKDNLGVTAHGHKVLNIITQKTGEKVTIPIWHWMLEEMLEKYNYNIPKIYEQKINRRIKDVGKLAEIIEPVDTEDVRGGMKVKTRVSKYKLIMTHTARRSGATNMYKKGIPSIDIMKITGHKTENSFLKYIRISKEETAERILAQHKVVKPLKKSV